MGRQKATDGSMYSTYSTRALAMALGADKRQQSAASALCHCEQLQQSRSAESEPANDEPATLDAQRTDGSTLLLL